MTARRPVVLVSRLYPGQEEAYEHAHAVVPGELADALERAGVRDWVIWRCGSDLLHLVDVDDYDAMVARLAAEPADHAWQARMRAYVEEFVDAPVVPDFDRLELVWSFRRQRRQEGAQR